MERAIVKENIMTNRKRVFVQVRNKTDGRWTNYKSANTYEEALVEMRKLQEKYPNATLRVLDNNLSTHTK